jgi:hypothetical protein
MILGKQSVSVAQEQSWTVFGVEEKAYEIRLAADNGWATLQTTLPTLYAVASEVGGRREPRLRGGPGPGDAAGTLLPFRFPHVRCKLSRSKRQLSRICPIVTCLTTPGSGRALPFGRIIAALTSRSLCSPYLAGEARAPY